jgi:hypothetical protein
MLNDRTNDHLVVAFPHQAVGCDEETQRAEARPKPKWVADVGDITLDVYSIYGYGVHETRTLDLEEGRASPTIKIQTMAATMTHFSDGARRASYLSV